MKGYLMEQAVSSVIRVNDSLMGSEQVPKVSTYSVSVRIGQESTVSMQGLVNLKSQELVCEPKFTAVGNFVEGVAPCKVGNNAGYVREDGTYLVEPSEEYETATKIVAGMGRIKTKEGMWKLFSLVRGEFMEGEFDKEPITIGENLTSAKKVLFVVENGEAKGIVRQDGVWLISLEPKGFRFIARDLVVVDKADRTQTLFNIAKEEVILSQVYNIANVRDGVYISYYTAQTKRALIKLAESGKRLLVTGYADYEILSETLVAAKSHYKNEERFDVYNIDSQPAIATVKGVENIRIIQRMETALWNFEVNGLLGIFNSEGTTVLQPLASTLEVVSPYQINVGVNDFQGIFDMHEHGWTVLPQFVDIKGPDLNNGSFRVAQEVDVGKLRRPRKVWEYRYSNGLLMNPEQFLIAGPFDGRGYASVTLQDGTRARLSEGGVLKEV